MIQFRKVYVLVAVLVLVGISTSVRADGMDYAHKEGSYRYLSQQLTPIRLAHVKYLGKNLVKSLVGYEAVREAACDVANQWVIAHHDNQLPNLRLVVPQELETFANELSKGYQFASRFDLNTPCSEYTNAALGVFIGMSDTMSGRREDAERSIAQYSSYKGLAGSTTLSLQLSPIPLTLELINGSLRLKFNLTDGRLKSTLAPGIKRVGSSAGLDFLYLDIDNERRVYDIRGLDLNLDIVERANFQLVKNKAIFTCSSSCVQFNPESVGKNHGVPSPKYQ